jgi:hypothetical protein
MEAETGERKSGREKWRLSFEEHLFDGLLDIVDSTALQEENHQKIMNPGSVFGGHRFISIGLDPFDERRGIIAHQYP